MNETPLGPLAEPGTPGPDPDSYWVIPDRLAAGPYPHTANPTAGSRRLEGLVAAGLTAFVNLTEDETPGTTDAHLVSYRDSLRTISPESVAVSQPIRDLDIPSIDGMAGTLDAIDRLLGEGHSVYIHCWGGIGRTGTVVGCWLIRHGAVEPGDALDSLARMRTGLSAYRGRQSPETSEQRAFVAAWEPGA
ncbi:MAG: phosphatase [Acidimicrobiia bacterium]|nr:phosphatase [Acidimicrobiia bacterium]